MLAKRLPSILPPLEPAEMLAFRRQGKADGVQRATHPLAAFGHGLVGKADNGEGGHARTDLDLHVHVSPSISLPPICRRKAAITISRSRSG